MEKIQEEIHLTRIIPNLPIFYQHVLRIVLAKEKKYVHSLITKKRLNTIHFFIKPNHVHKEVNVSKRQDAHTIIKKVNKEM